MNTTNLNPLAHWKFSPGQTLPQWQVVAVNDATESRNPMHDDRLAKQLGFDGGLVPGVTLYGYLTHPLVAIFGQGFLEHGSFEARFRRPVYAGETVTTEVKVTAADPTYSAFELALTNAAGDICVVGSARFPAADATTRAAPAQADLPTERRPATPEELRARPLLGSLQEIFTGAQSAKFLAVLGDDLALYQSVVHPSWLLRQANFVVDRNLAVGPWIHVASEIQHLGVVQLDEPFTVCAQVVELSAHKGKDYADVDVLIATSRPVLRVQHRVIYRMPVPS
jgi:acyl dehydratase